MSFVNVTLSKKTDIILIRIKDNNGFCVFGKIKFIKIVGKKKTEHEHFSNSSAKIFWKEKVKCIKYKNQYKEIIRIIFGGKAI